MSLHGTDAPGEGEIRLPDRTPPRHVRPERRRKLGAA
jgi:hypothetical protein